MSGCSNSGKPGICVSCDRADDGLSGSFWYEMDGAPAGCTCLPEAGRGDCDSCRRWHGEHDEGSLPQYVFLGLSADLPHGICCQGSEAIRDPGRYPEEDPPGDRPDGSKDPKNHAPFKPTLKTRMWFSMIRWMHKAFWKFEPDYGYWEEHGWHGKNRPWKVKRKKRG